jgi:hypothetical protein
VLRGSSSDGAYGRWLQEELGTAGVSAAAEAGGGVSPAAAS